VLFADENGVIRFWNAGCERIFGHPASEALGQSLDLIIPANLRPRHWQGFTETMRTGQSRYAAGELLAVPALHKDGSRVSIGADTLTRPMETALRFMALATMALAAALLVLRFA